MIERTMFVLAVPNLAESAAYYRDVLGFSINEIGDPGWRQFTREGASILAGECADAIPPAELGDHSYFAYFVVSDAQAFFDHVSARSADIIKPLRDEPWGMREFALRTLDGHRIMFGQSL